MRLAKSDLLRILAELAAALPSQKDRDLQKMADGYYGALEDCSVAEVQWAKDAVIREDRFFPAASRLRRLAFDYRKGHPVISTDSGTMRERFIRWLLSPGEWHRNGCPVCGSVLSDKGEGTRYHVYHDHQRHVEARIPYVGPETGPVDKWGHIMPTDWQPEPEQLSV